MASLVTVIIIDNQPEANLIGVTKWADMKYKQVLKYYWEKYGKEAKIPEDKAYEIIMPYL